MQRQIQEEVVNSRLAAVKDTLLSMLPLFIPSRRHKEITLDLAKRSMEVTTCISKLIEQAKDTSSLVGNISQLEEWVS